MFDNSANPHVRPVAVGIPEGQRTERGSDVRHLRNMLPAQMFAVQYVDDEGAVHDTVAMRIGGDWYLPPNGEAWSASLRRLKGDTWLAQQLSGALLTQTAPLPQKDAVDILGSG